jgi:hypothetical protein
MDVHDFVDEGLGHSSHVIDLGDGAMSAAGMLAARGVTALAFDRGPSTWIEATGHALEVGR